MGFPAPKGPKYPNMEYTYISIYMVSVQGIVVVTLGNTLYLGTWTLRVPVLPRSRSRHEVVAPNALGRRVEVQPIGTEGP